jgi:hypothetical protein
MPLSWNEIRQRAITFSRNWSEASRERAEAQTFWNEFFDVFGIRRRTVATFEEPVKNLCGDCEFIDLFWPGRLIAEHKSRGRDLSKASTQANGYCLNLLNTGRRDEMPRYILVSDFARFALHDLEAPDPQHQTLEFDLGDLHKNIRRFAFISGHEIRAIDPEDPANIRATELLANVHDRLEDVGYSGHDLQRFMVRILFCLFADDTGIFQPDSFKLWLANHTRADGSDLGTQLSFLFQILDTPEERRPRNLDEDLAAFPYVNGELYRERLTFPVFDSAMRVALMECCRFQWQKISPAVFGSLFQSVMDTKARRQIGAHYTSERDILKLVRSLFLDGLRAEFESIRQSPRKLEEFHRKLGTLKLLDPACGCGNFLVLAYRELRRLELDVLTARFGKSPDWGDLLSQVRLNVGQFFGIEIEEWPVRIAEVALWLMDHQMNQELFERFGGMPATIPLKSTPHIRQANALRIDWNQVLPAGECSCVLGNPPFVGSKFLSEQQRGDMAHVTAGVDGAGTLDFVTGWYFKAAEYMAANRAIRAAFVSTNSITQGEQVGILWPALFARGVKIHFGHRTFVWQSEARGKAHVHVVIIGFGLTDAPAKTIFDYVDPRAEPTATPARNISPYLVEGSDIAITSRSRPLCDVPEIRFGNQPIDGGHLLLTAADRDELLAKEPDARKWIRRYVGAEEFINGIDRYCLWLEGAPASELRALPEIMRRLQAVREFRLASKRPATRELARTPAAFAFKSQPEHAYLLIPSVSSERRAYIPIGFMPPTVVASNLCLIVANASRYHFGVLSSDMHMAWVRQVCGRLKSDYRYSNKLVYNNYPWPISPNQKHIERVERCAERVLGARVECGDGRAGFLPRTTKPRCSLADLYDPLAMPAALAEAHQALDRAVDACYRSQPFASERQRVEYLFALYEQLTAPLAASAARPRRRAKSKT